MHPKDGKGVLTAEQREKLRQFKVTSSFPLGETKRPTMLETARQFQNAFLF